ncbi:MAG: DUF4173 domain-containing protein [Lachnospiraceae bacterium]|nr:DUF4173 domain-containing protein [Lachnospiraceae bacterium]
MEFKDIPNGGTSQMPIPGVSVNEQTGSIRIEEGPIPTPQGVAPAPGPIAAQVEADKQAVLRRMREESFRHLGKYALIFALLYVLCLYKNRTGITYPIYTLGALWLIWKERKEAGAARRVTEDAARKGMHLFYAAAILLLAVSRATTMDSFLHFFDWAAMVLLTLSLLISVYTGTENESFLAQLGALVHAWVLPLIHLAVPFLDWSAFRRSKREAAGKGGKKSTGMYILIGLLISVPLLAVIISLLASADLVFSRILERMIYGWSLPDFFGDLVGILFFFCAAFLCIYIWMSRTAETNFRVKEITTSWEPVIAITFNALIAVVYLLFSGIQFVYLVGHMELPGGYTYAEYAHEGFYQLLAVVILNLILVSFCKKFFGKNRALQILLLIISLCTYIMIASAGMRMILYVQAYGFTRLRIYVLWALVALAYCMSVLTVSIFREHTKVYRLCVIFVTCWYLAFAFSHPDAWIARYNLSLDKRDDYLVYDTSLDAATVIHEAGGVLSYRYFQQHNEEMADYMEGNLYYRIRHFNTSLWSASKYYDHELHVKEGKGSRYDP